MNNTRKCKQITLHQRTPAVSKPNDPRNLYSFEEALGLEVSANISYAQHSSAACFFGNTNKLEIIRHCQVATITATDGYNNFIKILLLMFSLSTSHCVTPNINALLY